MRGRHIIGLSILSIMTCAGLYTSYATLFAVHNLVFCIDDHITDTEKHSIMALIHTLHERETAHIYDNMLPIRQQFPFIESIAITLLPNNIMQYTIHAAKPCCIVNQELAFTHNNTLVNKQIFTPTHIQNLPAIFIDEIALQKEQDLCGLQDCITNLLPSLFAEYTVAWYSPIHMRLYDKSQPQFSIIFSADHLPDTRTISACTTLKQNLPPPKRNRFTKNRQSNNGNWAADIRFNNQIILYADKGDRGHG